MPNGRDYGHAHRLRRKALLDTFVDGTLCNICGMPMTRAMQLDLGHVIPLAMGGKMDGPVVFQHRHCNRSQGASAGNTIRRKPGYKPAKPKRQLPKW